MHIKLKRFGRDRRGVAAVEFALISPILIMFYFASAELCQAQLAEKKASHLASAVSDLVTQNSSVTPTDITGIFGISATIMEPFPVSDAKLQFCVFSATKSAASKITVDWIKVQGTGASALCPTKGATLTEQTDPTKPVGVTQVPIMGTNETVIGSRSKYTYTGISDYFIHGGFPFTSAFYLRPRKSDQIACTTC